MPRVMAIAAHPDDIEFLMSGTLFLLNAVGYEIHYMNLADGSCGSMVDDAQTTAAIRLEEAKQAASQLEAIFYPPLCADLEVFYEKNLLQQLTAIIRKAKPDILLTHSPSDYMEDHTNTCRLAVSAAFCRGMPNFLTEPHTSITTTEVTIYHAQPYQNHDPLRKLIQPELFIDTTDVIENKVEMLACHKSQKEWLDKSQGLNSYLQTLRNLDQEVGNMSDKFRFAEGWRRHLHTGFCQEQDDPLSEALKQYVLKNPRYRLD